MVFRLPKAFADGADAGTGMVAAGFVAGGCSALAKTMEIQRLHKSASTLSGSAHNSFALIPIRTMASEMASSADTRQLLCRTQPQRLADGFNLGEELRHRRLSRLRASARARSCKFATSSAQESETEVKGNHLPFNPYMYWCTQLVQQLYEKNA